MGTATQQLTELAGQWRDARRLYLLYGALQQKFDLGVPPCPELESPINRAETEALDRVWAWFAQMDERVHVHQLRQLLQTTPLGTEENLRAIITRHLDKENKVDADRDKVDFLLVQYLGSCAPPGFHDKAVSFEDCASALEPVIGEVGMHTPKWLEPLDECLKDIEHCQSIRELLSKGILDETRLLKVSSGEMYFGPTALVAITRFNFLARRGFVRMIAADLHAIRSTLRELELHGIATLDCSKAGLAKDESLNQLRDICKEWKKAFHAAYAAGQSFKQLVDVRTIVEERLNQALAEKLQREAQETARAAAEQRARLEAEERARQEAEEAAQRDAEEKARVAAEAQAKREEQARIEAEQQAQREAEARARLEAEERSRREAEEKARREAELAALRQAEEERSQAEAKAKQEKEEAEQLDAYERAIRETEEKEKREAEEKLRLAREAEEQAKREAVEKAHLEEEERKRREKEEYERDFARLEAEENARKEADAKATREAEERAKKEADAGRPKTQEELELEAYEAAVRAAEGLTGPPAPIVSAGGGAAAAPARANSNEVDIYRAQVEEQIKSLAPRDGAVATIALGPLKLLLSSWEVSAYANGKDLTAEILQRAVAARAVLLVGIDQRKYSGNSEQVRSALWQAQVEAEKIQAQVAVSKGANDIDAACNLAATSKRLMSLVDEAEKLK